MKQAGTDLEQLRTLCNGDSVRMQRYIRMFLQGTAPALDQLKADLKSGDLQGLTRNAHALKPQSAHMGAAALKEALERLEHAANAGHSDEAHGALEECVQLHAQVVTELKAALDHL